MDNQASRRRASSAATSKADTLELQNQLTIFSSSFQGRGDSGLRTHQNLIHAGQSVRQILLETSNSYRAREAFRHLNGFQTILTAFENIIRNLRLHESDTQEDNLIQDLIQMVCGVLSAALQEHKGNQKHFRRCCPGGGWQSLRNSGELLIEYLKEKNLALSEAIIERLFGCLLSCATNDDIMVELFGKLRRHRQGTSSQKGTESSK